jgi:hypothetical protein
MREGGCSGIMNVPSFMDHSPVAVVW